MRAVRTIRDWRGIKYHLNQLPTDQVLQLRDTAQETSQQIAHFIVYIETELAFRMMSTTSSRQSNIGVTPARLP